MTTRSTKRTPQMVDEILRRLAAGEPLAVICRDQGMPHPTTWRDWCHADNSLAIAYAGAREDGEDHLAAQCLEIADNPSPGLKEKLDADGKVIEVSKEDMLGHRKLQIETRLKLLAKWNPKRWGEKALIGSDPDNPLPAGTASVDVAELAKQLRKQKLAPDAPQDDAKDLI